MDEVIANIFTQNMMKVEPMVKNTIPCSNEESMSELKQEIKIEDVPFGDLVDPELPTSTNQSCILSTTFQNVSADSQFAWNKWREKRQSISDESAVNQENGVHSTSKHDSPSTKLAKIEIKVISEKKPSDSEHNYSNKENNGAERQADLFKETIQNNMERISLNGAQIFKMFPHLAKIEESYHKYQNLLDEHPTKIQRLTAEYKHTKEQINLLKKQTHLLKKKRNKLAEKVKDGGEKRSKYLASKVSLHDPSKFVENISNFFDSNYDWIDQTASSSESELSGDDDEHPLKAPAPSSSRSVRKVNKTTSSTASNTKSCNKRDKSKSVAALKARFKRTEKTLIRRREALQKLQAELDELKKNM